MIRLLMPLLGVALTLGACNSRSTYQTASGANGGPRYASLDAQLGGSAGRVEQRASPVVVLPAWIGRPIRLRERDDAGAFEQMIALDLAPKSEPRENLVLVTMPRSQAAADRLIEGTASAMAKPTEAGIRAELDGAFPGIPMQVVPRPAKNAYGPYGLAIGRTSRGALCLYAWQWIEEPPAIEAGARGPLSLRVRLCRTGVTLEAMAASVNQLRLVPRFEGTPVSIGVAARPAVERRERVRHARIEREPAAAAMPVAEPDSSGRRYLGADPEASPSYRSTSAPAGALRAGLAGLGAPMPSAPARTISADLPPEAYRGPSSSPVR